MTITRYYPWAQNQRFQANVKQAFERFVGVDENDASAVTASQWTPRVDIKEEDQRFVIVADIPGVDPNAIEIHMDKGVLSIKGDRAADAAPENTKTTRSERQYGAFNRRFALPDSADADNISASGKHGVLEISIPKKPETTPRRIAVSH
jgi:HSP20 family protein